MDRRGFLRVGAAAFAANVAGCGLGTDDRTQDDAGDSSSTPADTATPTDTPTPELRPTSADPADAAQVVAGVDGERMFDPKVFEIERAETVVQIWHNSGHNIRATARPRGPDFMGTAGGDEDLYSEGHTFPHTFEVAGEYEYHCYPHRNIDMTGWFTVTE